MRTILVGLVIFAAACGGDDGGTAGPDAPIGTNCPLPADTADAGTLAALKAQRCNVDGSMGNRKWYRLSATLEGTGNIVQLELWPNTGAFTAAPGTVMAGSFPVDTDFAHCGVCVRAIGNKGDPSSKEYFATAGMVNITALGTNGQPISATITNATLVEVNASSHVAIPGGCTASIEHVQVDGTVMDMGGTGGGGGGGGGNGMGKCPTTVGD